MGQNLTHGVYLPDEGERNCYNGLAANWQLLDNSVGTVAEHTSALAGKAPLVHTHSKADITDFPVYGTTAGTICEGNDSRLSDARTPVAHTHGKADITDLFNSANTWTGDNTYTATISYQTSYTLGNPPQSDDSQTALKINDSAGANYLAQITTFQNTDATGLRIVIRDKFDSNGFSPSGSNRNKYFTFLQNAANQSYLQWDGYINNSVAPLANNSYDLGSSSYQWNKIYSKGYYYNGTAWGLDKANEWSNYNSYSKGIELAGNRYAYILPEFAANYSGISILTNSFGKSVKFGSYTVDENSVVSLDTTLGFIEISAGIVNNVNSARIQPRNAVVAELGTSANKWKSLNGINPGALSLPDLNTAQTIDRTGWAYDGSTYNAIKLSSTDTNMTKNGWLYVRISSTGSSDKLSIKYNSIGDKYPTSSFGDTGGCIEVFVPVIADSNIYLCATKDLQFCKFYPCLGNVPSGV